MIHPASHEFAKGAKENSIQRPEVRFYQGSNKRRCNGISQRFTFLREKEFAIRFLKQSEHDELVFFSREALQFHSRNPVARSQ